MSQQSRQLTPVETFRADLTARRADFIEALPPQVSVEKFQRVVVTAIAQNPSLLEADRRSLWLACMKAAQDGLLPDNREAAFVQFGKEISYMPMVGGVLKKIRNSGEVSVVDAITVHKNDKFRYRPAVDSLPDHEPEWFGDRGEMIGVYAFAKMKDGSTLVRVFNKTQIEKRRAVSKAKDGAAWKNWYEEKAQVTVLHSLAKRLPQSTDLEKTLENIESEFVVDNQPPEPAPAPAAEPQADKPTGGRRRPSGLQRAAESQAPTPNETVVDDTSNAGDQPPI